MLDASSSRARHCTAHHDSFCSDRKSNVDILSDVDPNKDLIIDQHLSVKNLGFSEISTIGRMLQVRSYSLGFISTCLFRFIEH